MNVPQNQISALNHYISKGIPRGGSIALVCVLYYESKLNPGSQGYQSTETPGVLNPHGAYGIASWNGPRQNSLLAFATQHNLPVAELATQLDFVLTELANSYHSSWAAIRSSSSYRTIIPIIVDEYENPKDKPKEIDGALAFAEKLSALPPQEAPQVALSPIQVSTIPSTPPIIPTHPLATLPSIPASTAGQVSAALDQLIAYQTDYRKTIPTPFDEAIASLEKLGAAPPSLPLQKPVSGSSGDPKPPPRKQTMEPQIAAAIRNALIFAGGYFVSKGWVDNATMISIAGGAVSLGGAAWSAWGHKSTSVIAAAAALPDVSKIVTTPAIADSAQFSKNPTVISH